MSLRHLGAIALVAALLVPAIAGAQGRLANVTPVDGGCIAGPTGNSNVESWPLLNDAPKRYSRPPMASG